MNSASQYRQQNDDDLTADEMQALMDEEEGALRNIFGLVLNGAQKIGIKKLSVNDRSWADQVSKHQNGVYVPEKLRSETAGLLPDRSNMIAKARGEGQHAILETTVRLRWLNNNGLYTLSRLATYTSKGSETHLTGLPEDAFQGLSPASFLIIAKKTDDAGEYFDCLTVDSGSSVYALVEDTFELQYDFIVGVFSPPPERKHVDELELLIDDLLGALEQGALLSRVASYSSFPATQNIAAEAQQQWLNEESRKSLNPAELGAPGNVLRKLSRGIEFDIYRAYERRFRAAQLLAILFKDGTQLTPKEIIRRVVSDFVPLYEVMRDAGQQRKSRAGASFEHHIARMLKDGGIPFGAQKVVSSRRPDFILPSVPVFEDPDRTSADALVLSAKTTLRERWKQVGLEKINCDLFLATLDENVPAKAIDDMQTHGITLVVPEALVQKESVTEYRKKSNVITFKTFFDQELHGKRLPNWRSAGLGA